VRGHVCVCMCVCVCVCVCVCGVSVCVLCSGTVQLNRQHLSFTATHLSKEFTALLKKESCLGKGRCVLNLCTGDEHEIRGLPHT